MPVRYECAYFDPISNYKVHTLLETHEFHSWTVSCLVSLFNEKWKYSTCYVFLSKINYCTGPDFAQNTDIGTQKPPIVKVYIENLLQTGLNSVLLPTLLTVVDNNVQHCYNDKCEQHG